MGAVVQQAWEEKSGCPRHVWCKAMLCQQREEMGPISPSPGSGPVAGRAVAARLFSGLHTPYQLKVVLDTACVCLLTSEHVLSLSSELKYTGSTSASPWLWSLPAPGDGRWMQVSLSHGFHFT